MTIEFICYLVPQIYKRQPNMWFCFSSVSSAHMIVTENFTLQGSWHHKLMIISRHLEKRHKYAEQTTIWGPTEIKLHSRSVIHSNKSHKLWSRSSEIMWWGMRTVIFRDQRLLPASGNVCYLLLLVQHKEKNKDFFLWWRDVPLCDELFESSNLITSVLYNSNKTAKLHWICSHSNRMRL